MDVLTKLRLVVLLAEAPTKVCFSSYSARGERESAANCAPEATSRS
jgi:hypothetical protein